MGKVKDEIIRLLETPDEPEEREPTPAEIEEHDRRLTKQVCKLGKNVMTDWADERSEEVLKKVGMMETWYLKRPVAQALREAEARGRAQENEACAKEAVLICPAGLSPGLANTLLSFGQDLADRIRKRMTALTGEVRTNE